MASSMKQALETAVAADLLRVQTQRDAENAYKTAIHHLANKPFGATPQVVAVNGHNFVVTLVYTGSRDGEFWDLRYERVEIPE